MENSNKPFKLVSPYKPTGDQPEAIAKLVEGIKRGDKGQTLLGVTGSGKTLTSFKTARLASKLPYIDKVLFVVDRKDLDYQTMKEYDRFEKGAANSNTSTTILKRQLEDPDAHIIITTIQKLATFIKKNPGHEVYMKHVVIIFDECHRSQFGDMHTAIVKNFKKYHLFGFTGTPIFSVNSGRAKNPEFFTTGQTFGDQLHSYTIVDAINDKNVLPFRVDYIKTMDVEEEITDEMRRILKLLSINLTRISEFAGKQDFYMVRANETVQHIFSELYTVQEHIKPSYIRIKLLELLLILTEMDFDRIKNDYVYFSKSQRNCTRQIHDFIVGHIKEHYTIEELAERFEISPTAMKRCFKGMYGAPVYAYLRTYRLQIAEKLLREGNLSVGEIATEIGYTNPNKFTSAFRGEYGMTPTEYKKNV